MTDPSNMIRNIMFGCQTMPAARWCGVKKQTIITNHKQMMVWSLEDGLANVVFFANGCTFTSFWSVGSLY